jgi:hypothetical protein
METKVCGCWDPKRMAPAIIRWALGCCRSRGTCGEAGKT